ncbi:unknown [Antheraea pernyi nucleopolyhedrovirus]|uniref:Uncharacterized protein n=2 Tax=Antheraea pernyi nuclear polyhedrosis virus TaxID=161494 RepID=Q1HGY3_NPVAP|nr:hypothetical protein APNV_p116 [Antheraea pernyi nucleopolyhedrovirus]AWD33637.1 hypothetical protein [Antheraea proylei nucleopolyhedrovirus]BBD50576.1 hypothetical protein [Antheraea yamamai nucleopolyhedrovirus]BBD50728.1 hypothetical protein [Samia cynthia nucleopolyhedrovirus]ABF50349.1 unknown [Antheraea pernyi nucleopolyhedrovirus]ABQ12345.1 unknown [Antheraea pernyi nucleopolyhedrovirus]
MTRPTDLYAKTRKCSPYMPHRQVPSLQAAAFSTVAGTHGLLAVAQALFEQRLFEALCLKWAKMYSDSVWVPHRVAATLQPDDLNYTAVHTYINYTVAPNLPFVNGLGCANAGHSRLKFVGMLRMEHKNRLDAVIARKNWDLLYVQCFVSVLDGEFVAQLLRQYKRFGKCDLNRLIYNFYEELCEV